MNSRASVYAVISVVLSLTVILLSPGLLWARPMVMRLAAVQGQDMTYVKALSEIAAGIGQRSGGRIRVEVSSGGRMGSEARALKRQINGRIHGGFTSGVVLAHTLPSFRLLTIPRLFTNNEEVLAFPGSRLERAMSATARRRNLKVLGYGSLGFYGVLSLRWGERRMEALPRDLYVRVPDESWMRKVHAAMGWRPVYAPMDDLRTATATGWVEGIVATPESLAGAFPPEGSDFFHQIRQMHGWTVFTVNNGWFRRLPPDLKSIVSDVVREVSARALRGALQREAQILGLWVSRGWASATRSSAWLPSKAERKVALTAIRKVERKLRIKGDVKRLWEQRNPTYGAVGTPVGVGR
ncbi:MAG: TRAP transporter substrate-binding protein DctP [Magnetococcales bacterium]|nr:TRAP transporter substrate-binding protein DctP [Magnetococcales bacterium]